MKLLSFNLNYNTLQNQNKICTFINKTNPDIGFFPESLPKFTEKFNDKFNIHSSCKYHPTLHIKPLTRNSNSLISKQEGTVNNHFLKHGIKKLVFDYSTTDLHYLFVHLSLNPLWRKEQIKELAQLTDEHTILAGDFNTLSLRELQPFTEKGYLPLIQQPTFPVWKPILPLDNVLVPETITAKAKIINTKLSDHLPIIARIK
ncbi:hypothetical protein COV18_00450 [Candidatus Woesearchaeota archaeon CG10_big_fil_rev_8_21_14_0_10_37_12]|nr:MAG: hypothetical protein COV18_00450 [Candidatus Woesearchaeota archaeon CG10_big_fil_rev_8_21_14_0_10_37_12]